MALWISCFVFPAMVIAVIFGIIKEFINKILGKNTDTEEPANQKSCDNKIKSNPNTDDLKESLLARDKSQ